MDPEDIVDDKTIDTNVEIETGIDTNADVKEGSDLDAKLDALAGIKPNATKTVTADNKGKVADDKTTDAANAKAREEANNPRGNNEQGNRQNGERIYQPRSYPKAYASDSKGNVILRETGEIIATAGGGRNAFERMLPLISSATGEAEKYKNMYEAAQNANVVAANLKLSPEEYSIGARIMAAYKSDPKKAIAFLVSEAQNNGVDVSDLGVGGGGGLSVQAIRDAVKEIVEEQIKPFSFITADRQAQEQDREATLEATRTTDEFLTTYPDAEIHSDAIAKIMNTRPGEIDIEKAYWILNSHAHKNGLDWSKPLAPQILAKLGNTQNREQPADNGRRLPNMNGRPNNENIVERRPTVMSGMASSNDIVKEAMREAGMVID